EKLKLRQVGYIESNMFLPIIRVHEGLPIHPSRIYIDEQKKLVVILSEQIIPRFFVEKLSKAIVEWIERKKISRIISLSGIRAVPEKDGKKIIYGIASGDKSKELLKKHEVQLIKEGITSGITALILLELKDKRIEAFSLLGNVEIAADYKASAALIEKLAEIIEITIDTEPLLKEAKETEKALLEHLERLKKEGSEVKKFQDTQTPMYT
ncbi:MAG: proteasome assembly chaperone family protein, partial [Candidatus Diapherotrites archaeon]|nr:proteasome assembly chaperone family protein [Candidatus Diapherotrites archaeon]